MLNLAVMTQWLNDFMAAQRQNIFLWVPVLFGTGVGLYFSLQREPEWWMGAGALAALGGISAVLFYRRRQVTPTQLMLLGLLTIVAGWCVAQARTHIVAAPVLSREYSPIRIEGTIRSLDNLEEGKGTRVILTDLVIEKIPPENIPRAIRLSIRKDEGLKPGQRIRILAGLNPPSEPVMPGSFDFQQHMYFRGIGAIGFAFSAPEFIDTPQKGGFSTTIESFRQNQANDIRDILPPDEAAIVSALLLGERAGISESVWQDIRAAGLAHVISISGLHIGMIAGSLFMFFRMVMCLFPRFALYHPVKKYAAFIALVGAVAYALMVGLSVPTLRSVIMTGIVLTAVMMDRSPFSMRIVALSAMVILLTTPEAMGNPGFQMSFGAVAALIFFYDETRGFWARLNQNATWWKKPAIIILGAAATSLVATIATAPYTLYHFQQFPIYSVVGNVLAMPVIGLVVMPAALVAYFLMPLGLEEWPLRAMGWGITVMLDISHDIANWPRADFMMPAWPLSSLVLFTLGGLILMIVRGPVRLVFIIPAIAAVILVATHRTPDMLVSGSGTLVLARTGEDHALINTRRTEKFLAGNWVRAIGLKPDEVGVLPREGKVERNGVIVSCDGNGCHYQYHGHRVAVLTNPRAAMADCGHVDLLISTEPVKKQCGKGTVIDRWDLRRNGTYAIYIDADQIRIETVAGKRGQRPWVR